jgi:hypothetical protein
MESDEGGYDYADLEGVWRRGVILCHYSQLSGQGAVWPMLHRGYIVTCARHVVVSKWHCLVAE